MAKKRSARETFRVPRAGVDLSAIDPAGKPIGPRKKADAAEAMTELGTRLDARQEALYASAVGGSSPRAVLLVLQGMDTSGKGGAISHVAGLVNPQGLHIASSQRPPPEALAHDFLWRIRKQVPGPGRGSRQERIHAFEAGVDGQGGAIVKCMLHITPEAQSERLAARLEDPQKYWKYNPGDLDARAKWTDYQAAYADALANCDTDAAPWYVVPSDRKWYRNWAVAALLAETLDAVDPQYPPADFDVEAEKARVRAAV